MDGRGAAGYFAGYESYTYDYGHGPASAYNYTSKSWPTSYPLSSTDGASHSGLNNDGLEAHFGAARYNSYDVNDRSAYGYSEPDVGYGSRRQSYPPRGWGGSPRGGFRPNLGSPPAVRGTGRPPPLLSPGSFSDVAGYQGLRAFTGNSYFGGGFKQKSKRSWKDRAARRKHGKEGAASPEKKMRPSTSTEDPEAKSEESESDGDGETEGTAKSTQNDKEEDRKEARDGERGTEQKQSSVKKQQESQSRRLRERMVERIQFICSLCKFRTFYEEEMSTHMQSDFHKEHFRFVGSRLPKQAAEFLEEYVTHKKKKTEERRQVIEHLSTTIQQIYRDQDLTQDLGMEHFVKKVEAAHCSACDVFIPMHFIALQRHLKTPLHIQNRKNMMEQSKKTALAVARSILNNNIISQKLERYIKGENPFTDDHEENTEAYSTTTETTPEDHAALSTLQHQVTAEECPSDQQNNLSFDESFATVKEQNTTENIIGQESCALNEGKEDVEGEKSQLDQELETSEGSNPEMLVSNKSPNPE
ncbi:uncharacterized protein WCC33_005159 [Rhinophrynus dorsalis]